MNIKGKKIILRAVEERDLPSLHEWSNDPYTQDIMGDIHFPSSFEFHKAWFAKLKDDTLNQRFAVEVIGTGGPIIGLSTIIRIDWKNNHAWHGIMLGPPMQGKGYGFDVIMTTMRYAFDELHMKRLDGSMIEYNAGSIRLYCEKCGWKKEGLRRSYYFRRGKYWDQVVVGITREDYDEMLLRTKYWEN